VDARQPGTGTRGNGSSWARVHGLRSEKARLHTNGKRRHSTPALGITAVRMLWLGDVGPRPGQDGKTRIRCSAVRESGSCTNRSIVYLREIEKAVLSGMREELKDRRLIEGYARKYNEERQRLRLQQRRRGHVSNQSALALRVSGNETSTWW